ncbi:MAG: glycosyltransferase family 2 protein [Opitutaceae bacterium]|nr:glycosyltransferase family 2 protein [Opitutaceae bacterium]
MIAPVVMIVFNRPALTRRVFERVRAARPPRLLVVCDGPRTDRPADAPLVEEVRRIFATGVDWPCEVVQDYADRNMGCMDRIHTGLDRAFALFEEAIILEDDCLPDPSFFPFCSEMLARHRDNPRVMNIAGTNFIANHYSTGDSYWFSHHPWTWGWASWRRAWQHNDFFLHSWDTRQKELHASFASRWERQYWMSTFAQAQQDLRATDCWDFQWNFSCRTHGGVSIVPRHNLVENLGFIGDSTHTAGDMSRLVVRTQPLLFPLRHPSRITVNGYADDLLTRVYAGETICLRSNLKARLRLLVETLRRA